MVVVIVIVIVVVVVVAGFGVAVASEVSSTQKSSDDECKYMCHNCLYVNTHLEEIL